MIVKFDYKSYLLVNYSRLLSVELQHQIQCYIVFMLYVCDKVTDCSIYLKISYSMVTTNIVDDTDIGSIEEWYDCQI